MDSMDVVRLDLDRIRDSLRDIGREFGVISESYTALIERVESLESENTRLKRKYEPCDNDNMRVCVVCDKRMPMEKFREKRPKKGSPGEYRLIHRGSCHMCRFTKYNKKASVSL